METRLSSATREVIIGPERPAVIIGERINPAVLASDLITGRDPRARRYIGEFRRRK